MKTINERLEYARKSLKVSYAQIGRLWGITADGARKAITRDGLNIDYVNAFAERYSVDKDWLINGIGQYKINTSNTNEDNLNIQYAPEGKFPKKAPDPNKPIDIFDVDFMAGNAIEMFEDATLTHPAYTMDIPQFNGCIGFRVGSESMEPKIKAGSIVFGQKLEMWFEHLEYGQIYGIVCHDGRKYLKYIKKDEKDEENYFLLVSENKHYDDFRIKKSLVSSVWLIHGWLIKTT